MLGAFDSCCCFGEAIDADVSVCPNTVLRLMELKVAHLQKSVAGHHGILRPAPARSQVTAVQRLLSSRRYCSCGLGHWTGARKP